MKVAIIPARGGSKRIPRKNIKIFAGKPMLEYAVGGALASGLFDAVAVSSEDIEILRLAEELGAAPLTRPAGLADDWTPTVPVIAHAVRALEAEGNTFEAVCCIYPGVPFLRHEDLAEALAILQIAVAEYVFPVVRFPSAVQRALRITENGRVAPFFSDATNIRSQDLEPAYYDAGQFYWGSRATWISERPIHLHGCGLRIPEWRAVDIDTPEDWDRAELMYRAFRPQEGSA